MKKKEKHKSVSPVEIPEVLARAYSEDYKRAPEVLYDPYVPLARKSGNHVTAARGDVETGQTTGQKRRVTEPAGFGTASRKPAPKSSRSEEEGVSNWDRYGTIPQRGERRTRPASDAVAYTDMDIPQVPQGKPGRRQRPASDAARYYDDNTRYSTLPTRAQSQNKDRHGSSSLDQDLGSAYTNPDHLSRRPRSPPATVDHLYESVEPYRRSNSRDRWSSSNHSSGPNRKSQTRPRKASSDTLPRPPSRSELQGGNNPTSVPKHRTLGKQNSNPSDISKTSSRLASDGRQQHPVRTPSGRHFLSPNSLARHDPLARKSSQESRESRDSSSRSSRNGSSKHGKRGSKTLSSEPSSIASWESRYAFEGLDDPDLSESKV